MNKIKCTPPRPIIIPPPRQHSTKQDKDIRAVRSISNPSLLSQAEEDEEQVEISLSQQFNAEYMDNVYSKYNILIGQPEEFAPMEVIKQITNVLDTISLEENILFLAMKFAESVLRVDDSWNGVFTSCAERNPLKYAEARGFVFENRLMMHIMMAIRTFKVIASAVEEGKLEFAMEVIDNLALSHLVMKVHPVLFKTFITRFIKCLIHFKLITEDLMPPFVYFTVNVINYVEKRMQFWEEMHTTLLCEMVDGLTAPSRHYYRELKKWKSFVINLYKTLSKPIQTFEKQMGSTQKLEQVITTDASVEEHWKIIRLLKKGYKYRTKTPSENFF